MDERHHTFIQICRMYTSKSKLYSQLWAKVIIKQSRVISSDKYVTLLRDLDNRNGCPCVWARNIWKLSSSQVFCYSKVFCKNNHWGTRKTKQRNIQTWWRHSQNIRQLNRFFLLSSYLCSTCAQAVLGNISSVSVYASWSAAPINFMKTSDKKH